MAPQNRIISLLIKIAVSSILLFILISKTGTERLLQTVKGISLISFLSSALLYAFSIFISSIRWNLLLLNGIGLKRLFSLYMVGSFFNNLMPGIIGGDAVKAYYLGKELKHESSNFSMPGLSIAVASVFMDRYIGFVSLLIIAIIAYPFGAKLIRGSYIEWILPVIIVAFVAGSAILFVFRLGKRLRFMSGFYEYLRYYKESKGIILRGILLSLLIQTIIICSAYIISRGLGIGVPFRFLFIIIPIISVISSIPVSISGIGVREASFVLFLAPLGVNPAQAITISLAWFLSFAMGSLPGLIFYLRQHSRP